MQVLVIITHTQAPRVDFFFFFKRASVGGRKPPSSIIQVLVGAQGLGTAITLKPTLRVS